MDGFGLNFCEVDIFLKREIQAQVQSSNCLPGRAALIVICGGVCLDLNLRLIVDIYNTI
jgi:hypothetical protein